MLALFLRCARWCSCTRCASAKATPSDTTAATLTRVAPEATATVGVGALVFCGARVGLSVTGMGARVGLREGRGEGARVGSAVGDGVGIRVGCSVGGGVGGGVGCSVGARLTVGFWV